MSTLRRKDLTLAEAWYLVRFAWQELVCTVLGTLDRVAWRKRQRLLEQATTGRVRAILVREHGVRPLQTWPTCSEDCQRGMECCGTCTVRHSRP